MDRHLVAVEVCVERGAYERMELYRTAVNEHGLERLDGQTVKSRSAVEQYGMLFDNVFEAVPYVGVDTVDLLLRVLDVGRLLRLDKTLHDERLEQLESHFLRQTALIYPQFGSDDYNGTSGVVDTFAEQVLTETSLLAAEHFGQRFQRSVARSGHGLAASAVVYQSVNGFLKHSFFVSYYYLGSVELYELSQPVVSVDDAPVKVVQVGGRKSAAVELEQRTEIRRDDRHDVEYHPRGLVSGFAESLGNVETFDQLDLLLTGGGLELGLQLLAESVYIDSVKQLFYRLGAHADSEVVVVFFEFLAVFGLCQSLHHVQRLGSILTDLEYDILTEVQHLVKRSLRNIEQSRHS